MNIAEIGSMFMIGDRGAVQHGEQAKPYPALVVDGQSQSLARQRGGSGNDCHHGHGEHAAQTPVNRPKPGLGEQHG
jgi:hypothetical protein